MTPRQKRALEIALIVSLLLHIAVLLGVIYIRIPVPVLASQEPIEVFNAKGMIADSNIPANRQTPKTARAIGIENNAVSQETVARPLPRQPQVPRQQQAARSTPSRVFEDEGPSQEGSRLNPPNRFRQKSQLPFNARSMYAVDPSLFAMKSPDDSDRESQSPRTSGRKGSSRSAMTYDMSGKGSLPLSDDFLPDYQYGDHTYVNIFRHPDVEYFVMLKRIFRQTWNPIPSVQYSAASGYPLTLPLQVVLAVSVSPQGSLSELFILKKSGMPAYDEEALRTIRASSPFSSPPAKLLKDGAVRMAWGFILY